MKKSELRKIIKEEIEKEVNNSNNGDLEYHANKFISGVLKMGTKKNIFDEFMRKNKIHESKLSEFVGIVISKIEGKYL